MDRSFTRYAEFTEDRRNADIFSSWLFLMADDWWVSDGGWWLIDGNFLSVQFFFTAENMSHMSLRGGFPYAKKNLCILSVLWFIKNPGIQDNKHRRT